MLVEPISVSELTKQIKQVFNNPPFQDLAVQGEISNFIHHRSGHMYFSLKDQNSRIKAVMFRGHNQHLNFPPKNGDTLIAIGSLGVYEPNGEYQLYVELLLPQGVGDLHLAFEQLKEKLQREGLFDPANKISLPYLPTRIGVITSPSGAALRDILNVLKRRHGGGDVLIFPALVQGDGAPKSLLEALAMSQKTNVDVIIMGRGGGSFEELGAFNDEHLARAIARSKIPIISAVGHETDFTIADFVADLRAPTPSAAAELVVPVKKDLVESIANSEERMKIAVTQKINSERRYLKQLTQSPVLLQPAQAIGQLRQKVDEQWSAIVRHNRHNLILLRSKLETHVGKLNTLSPLETLGRGYSICQDHNGKIVRDAKNVAVGSSLRVRLHRGDLLCKVEGSTTHE
mgnify:FL=1